MGLLQNAEMYWKRIINIEKWENLYWTVKTAWRYGLHSFESCICDSSAHFCTSLIKNSQLSNYSFELLSLLFDTRSISDRSVELLYKCCNSVPVGWPTQNGNQSCSWGRCNVNTDRPQLQLHRVLHSRGISQFTLYTIGLDLTWPLFI